MACKEFYDLNHIQSYLGSSIVRYNGKPIYIQQCTAGANAGQYLIRYCSLDMARDDEQEVRICNYPDDVIDLTPVPLGMVNVPGGIVHVCRSPHRQWKIGLSSRNVSMKILHCKTDKALVAANRLPFSEHLEDTILGKYPTLDKILGMARPIGAFSRRFGVIDKHLAYRTRHRVGKIIHGRPVLDDNFFYLREVLMEDLNAKRPHDQRNVRAA